MQHIIKRLFDIISSFILTILLLPLWFIVAIAIKLDSKGPVLYKQSRITQNGKVFKLLKFRSMIVDAERMGTGLFNYENDPRVTRVGRLIRNSSIDELPQLLNIIIGDMSVVGPRPCVVNELGDYNTLNRKYKKRFTVKAGLTGMAQVIGRNDISWDEKVEYDNQYVDLYARYGVLIDLKILVLSVIKIFKREHIYEKKVSDKMTDEEAARFESDRIIQLAHIQDNDLQGEAHEV